VAAIYGVKKMQKLRFVYVFKKVSPHKKVISAKISHTGNN
jgi:hypothetical protein